MNVGNSLPITCGIDTLFKNQCPCLCLVIKVLSVKSYFFIFLEILFSAILQEMKNFQKI